MELKAIEILKNDLKILIETKETIYTKSESLDNQILKINEAIRELEQLDNKKCKNCITYIKEPDFFSFKCNILCINPHENFSCSEHKYKE